MLHTNINITNNSNTFQYIIEYGNPKDLKQAKTNIKYLDLSTCNNGIHCNDIVFVEDDGELEYFNYVNHWYAINEKYTTEHTPVVADGGVLRLYFPTHSIDTYVAGCEYALTINTWIQNRRVVLGEYIFNRLDAVACDRVKLFNNEEYYECIEFSILDAMSLMYSDDWKKWRKMVCKEPTPKSFVNSEGSALYITLHPVTKVDEGYIKMQDCVGGQGAMNITYDSDDFLSLDIHSNTSESLNRDVPAIECNLKFNKYYNGDLKDYLIETYGNYDYKVQYEMVIGNSDDIYSIVTSKLMKPTTYYKFPKNKIENFTNGIGWKQGINIICSINIFNGDESVIYILSNTLPLTEDLFRYFVQTQVHCDKDDCEECKTDLKIQNVNYVNLQEVDMNLINLNVVNKIENQIVQIDRPVDAKACIMQPVFFKVSEGTDLTVHPEVTEVVCLNLDKYKSSVTSFILQIEGVHFVEYGRNVSGVLFRIVGNKLPKETSQGTYYLLNQDEELVTTGKYTYMY